MNTDARMTAIAFGCLLASSQALAVPNYSINENPMPGAQVTTTYSHNAGGRGITPYYGYYVTEFPSLNDYGHIAGRTDVENSPSLMIKGSTSGQAAVWKDGVIKNIKFGNDCRDVDGDGEADASACGSRALTISNLGLVGGSTHVNMSGRDSYFESTMSWWPGSEGEYDGSGGGSSLLQSLSQSQIEDINNQSNAVGIGITAGGAGPQDSRAHGLVNIAGVNKWYIGMHNQTSSAHALNENNIVTGGIVWNEADDYTSGAPTSLKAYTWHADELTVVQDGITDPTFASEGYDINDSALVVGHMGYSGNVQAFKWASPNGSLEELGSLGGSNSVARSVNNAGTIIGWASTSSGATHGFIYENGSMYDLNDYAVGAPGFVIVDAYSINESGQVLVRASNASTGENQYWLLTDPSSPPPTPPEPQAEAVEITSMAIFGGTGTEQPIKVMADGFGNTISVGYYNKDVTYYLGDKAIDFDPSSSEDVIESTGQGVYIQKLDANGNYLWTKLLRGHRLGGYHARITDLFVESDGSFHLIGWKTYFGSLDINPDPNVTVRLENGYGKNVSFRATYSSTGELVSSVRLTEFIATITAKSVAVDAAKNIYMVYSSGGGQGVDLDFDPGPGVANVKLEQGRPAIVVTKTSRDSSGIEKLEWVKSMSSVGKRNWRNQYEDGYARISSLSIAAPAVADEGPMLAFTYMGAINFQVMDSNLGLIGASQPVGTSTEFSSGFIRMTESGGPSALWVDPESYNWGVVKLVRSGDHFGLLLRAGTTTSRLLHGVAADTVENHNYRSLAGRAYGIDISQQGAVYTSGWVSGSANFDPSGYDVQGNTPSFVTKINTDGSYGWTSTYQLGRHNTSSVATDRFGNITVIDSVYGEPMDQDGNILSSKRSYNVRITRMAPVQ